MRRISTAAIHHLYRGPWSKHRISSISKTQIRKASFVGDDDTANSRNKPTIASILEQVSNGTLSIKHAENEIFHTTTMREQKNTPTSHDPSTSDDRKKEKRNSDEHETLQIKPFANLDHERASRTSFPEVVFADGKPPEQLVAILDDMAHNVNTLVKEEGEGGAVATQSQRAILATRVSKELYEQISTMPLKNGVIHYHEIAKIVTVKASALHIEENGGNQDFNEIINSTEQHAGRKILVACAGTTDIPVAEEAVITLEAAGIPVERIYDVGVAGLHRIVNAIPKLRHPDVGSIIVCAGMDGALPSVVAGLVSVPVIAVPTSVGYGASFGGMSAMLTMLNSCAPGVGVVNIDNGFGGAALAYKFINSNN